ncbi:glycoside hydrolase family 76 [Arachidicoccus soli]|uniref:Glycoside hydrolase family 76 n=1 Tax=Arachidicoccus soli TaxID=2341117 RepID=A0A386HTK9_9BACT|nr:glycoside hydrolase family 76 [Arachidicoccus soli]
MIYTKFKISFLALIILCFQMPQKTLGQNYSKLANNLQKQIQQDFYLHSLNYYREFADSTAPDHKVSYLWSLCALWQADNEMEIIDPKKKYLKKDFTVIEKYNDNAPPAPGFDSYPAEFKKEDRYYDDNQWIGLTAMDAYKRTNQQFYLNIGEKIYRFMMTGFDTVSGGGLYWKEGDRSTKNTCSNGPGIILALQLYQATHQKTYLDTALLLYRWMNKHLQAPSGLYYDNLKIASNTIAKYQFSYNTGTMLQSNIYLYECSKQKKYLKEANRIAEAALKYFYADSKFRDDYWFNAVLLRAYQQLLKYNPDTKYILAFKKCVDNAIENNVNKNGLMGKPKPLNLVAQGGMLEILARLAWLQKEHYL